MVLLSKTVGARIKDDTRVVLGLIELCPTQTVFLIPGHRFTRKESDLGYES